MLSIVSKLTRSAREKSLVSEVSEIEAAHQANRRAVNDALASFDVQTARARLEADPGDTEAARDYAIAVCLGDTETQTRIARSASFGSSLHNSLAHLAPDAAAVVSDLQAAIEKRAEKALAAARKVADADGLSLNESAVLEQYQEQIDRLPELSERHTSDDAGRFVWAVYQLLR